MTSNLRVLLIAAGVLAAGLVAWVAQYLLLHHPPNAVAAKQALVTMYPVSAGCQQTVELYVTCHTGETRGIAVFLTPDGDDDARTTTLGKVGNAAWSKHWSFEVGQVAADWMGTGYTLTEVRISQ